jgi:hypothetical protein
MKKYISIILAALFLAGAGHVPTNKRYLKKPSFSRKRPKNIPIRKPKLYKTHKLIYFTWPVGLEMFGAECPNKGFVQEVYGQPPNLLYEVRVECKGDIEKYEHFFLIHQSQIVKIIKRG